MMKTGTTWLYSVLDKHPDIYFTYEKEIHYFAHRYTSETPLNNSMRLKRTLNAIDRDNPDNYNPRDLKQKLLWYSNYIDDPNSENWYFNLFKFKGNEKYCADFSNLTCHIDKKGWDAIKQIARNLKVIIILRHPIKRLFSHVNFHLMFINRHDEILKWKKNDYIGFCKKEFIWKNSFYSNVIESIMKNLNESQYKIFFYEELVKDRKKFLNRLEKYLDIRIQNYADDVIKKKVNATKKTLKPPFFDDLFRTEFVEDTNKLIKMGLKVPYEWSDLT